MSDGYQVQIDGLSGAWHAVTPESPHGPCGAVHQGDHWHASLPDAQAHAEKVAELLTVRAVRIVRRDTEGRTSIVQPAT